MPSRKSFRHRFSQLSALAPNTFLLTAGVACIVGATAARGVNAAGIQLPAVSSIPRQIILGLLGVFLVSASLYFHTGTNKPEMPMTLNSDRLSLPAPTPRPRLSMRFTGRADLLRDLNATLGQFGRAVLVGLGGVGKTQVALAYINERRSEYEIVWWVRAEEGAILADDFIEIGRVYGVAFATDDSQPQKITIVREWLSQRERWLIVFDNVEDTQTLAPFLPSGPGGHILLSSRRRMWWDFPTLIVAPWKREESIEFLRHAVEDSRTADALADQFGDLPLALEQASTYVQETSTSPADYLDLIRKRMPEMLGAGTASNYSRTVATAWSVSFDRVRREVPEAQDVLRLYAFFAAEGIPHTLLTSADPKILSRALRTMVDDRLAYNRAISALVRYSLIQASRESVTVHRLVQAVTRQDLTPNDAKRYATMAARVARAAFPSDVGYTMHWQRCSQLLPHAMAAARHAQKLGVALEDATWLFERVGSFLRSRGEYDLARTSFESALSTLKGPHDFVDPDPADVFNKLGMVLRATGLLIEARDTFLEAERMDAASRGSDHPHVASILDNLGTVYRGLGDIGNARTAHERALAIKQARLPSDHIHLAVTLNGLGTSSRELGDLAAAREYHERALEIRQNVLGDDHPDVSTSRNNLGNVLADLGEFPTARLLLTQAMRADEAAFGPDSPVLAADLTNLGTVLFEMNNLDEARQTLERALAINEHLLGPEHPDVAAILNNLGVSLHLQGELDLAHDSLARALVIDESAIGPNHRDVAKVLVNVAVVDAALGDPHRANAARNRARSILASADQGPVDLERLSRWIRIDKDVAIAETEPDA